MVIGDIKREGAFNQEMEIAITFDVERNWHSHDGIRGPNFPLEYGFSMITDSIPIFLDMADDYGIKFTFLVTGEVAREKANLIKMCSRKHEVGCHTHPYYHDEFKGNHANDLTGSRLNEYTLAEQLSMIKKDSETIQEMIGIQPRSFRAGRFGIDVRTLRVLEKLGYHVDSSLQVSRYSVPYHPSRVNLKKVGAATIVEVPVSGFLGQRRIIELSTSRRIVRYQFLSHRILRTFLVVLCHPMEYTDPHIDQDRAFRGFQRFVNSMHSKGANFLTLGEIGQFAKGRSVINLQLRTLMGNLARFIRTRK